MSGRALTCWWITNGAAGFRTQARGLAEAVIPGADREDGRHQGALVAGAACAVAR